MYLNQEALWTPVIEQNDYGDMVYADTSVEIDVRRQEHVEEVRTKDGTLTHTNYVYYVDDDVKIDDRLDGYLVVSVYDMRTLGGRRILRRAKTI